MHGIHIAQDIVKEAKKQGEVRRAVIEVGELANIISEDLYVQLKNVADFEFEMVDKDARIKCSCGFEGRPKIIERQHDIVLYCCPECEKTPDVIEGDGIKIISVEVD